MIGHKYTENEKEFMKKYVSGHCYREIQKAFVKEFGWEITLGQIKSYITNHGLNTGRNGCFEKGHVPHNKGKKGYCAPGCKKTWFQKGNMPDNHRKVGSERVNKDGYIEVKVEEPNVWRLKHRVVWENVHGEVPKDCIVIFRDGNKENTDISNLRMIKRSTNAVLNHTGLNEYTGEEKDIAIGIAELKIQIAKAKKRRKS